MCQHAIAIALPLLRMMCIVDATPLLTRSMLMYSMPQKWSPMMPLMAATSKTVSLNAIGTYVKPAATQMVMSTGIITFMREELWICALTFLGAPSLLALLPAELEEDGELRRRDGEGWEGGAVGMVSAANESDAATRRCEPTTFNEE